LRAAREVPLWTKSAYSGDMREDRASLRRAHGQSVGVAVSLSLTSGTGNHAFLNAPLPPGIPFPSTGVCNRAARGPQALTAMLDETALEAYAEVLQRAGARIVDYWRPGLSDDAIDKLAQVNGVVLPEETRRLWRWHDGSSQTAPPEATEIAPGRRFLPLEVVLSGYAHAAADFRDLYGFDQVIEVFPAKPMIYFDCRGSIADPVPILVSHNYEEPEQKLSSVGDLFIVWTGFVNDGLWGIRNDGLWDGNYIDRLSDEILDLGVY